MTTSSRNLAIKMYGQTKHDLLKQIEFEFLARFSIDTKLLNIKKYYTKKDIVNALSRRMNLTECKFVLDLYKKGNNAIETADVFLRKMKPTSDIIKIKFIEYLVNTQQIKRVLNDVCFFEFNVGATRTDINRINNYSYAYEIKTARDKPNRAFFQTKEFSQVFEYVFVITNDPEIEREDNIGIFLMDFVDGEIVFDKKIKARKNDMNPPKQLMSLPKIKLRELTDLDSKDKQDLVKDILPMFRRNEINAFFKKVLKDTYRERWIRFYKELSAPSHFESPFPSKIPTLT